MVTEECRAEFAQVRRSVAAWAEAQDDIVAAAVVGSWARGTPGMSSDMDIVVLTWSKARYVADAGWIRSAVGQEAELVRTAEWGPLTERRVQLRSGAEVDFGFVHPSWAVTNPVDPGTAGVVLDGCAPVVDREGMLAALIATVRQDRLAP